MDKKIKILHLEDLPGDAELIGETLKKSRLHFEREVVDTKDKFINALKEFSPDIVLADHSIPSFDSHEALAVLQQSGLKIPFILITATMPDEFAVEVIKGGADDYILKDRLRRLPIAINKSLEKQRHEKERENFLFQIMMKEKHHRALIENIHDAIILFNENAELIYQSPSAEHITGFVFKQVKKKKLFDYIHPDDLRDCLTLFEQVRTQPGISLSKQYRVKHKKGHYIWLEGTITNLLHDESVKAFIVNYRDITERKNAEEKLINANRLYTFISEINQTIVHVKEEQTLFKEACRIAIEQGKFKMAWIGIADTTVRKVRLAASCGTTGTEVEVLTDFTYSIDGPIEKTLTGQDYHVVKDISKEFETQYVKERNLNSAICLALKKSGIVFGTFIIYSSQINFFNSEEIALLKKVASDISFALDVFENDKQRTLTEQKLEHSELRLKQAQEIAHVGNWEMDFSTGIATWSDEHVRIFGLAPGDNRQNYETWKSFIHPEDFDHVMQKTSRSKSTSINSAFFNRIVRPDGTIRHLYTQTRTEYNSEGKATGLYGVAHDVTEIREAEEALRQSESNLQAIFENTSEGFILTDLNGIVKAFNNKTRDIILLNTGNEIKKGDSIYNFIHQSRKDQYDDTISRVISGETLQYDYPFERKDGTTKWFNFTVNPVYSSGEIKGLCITTTDITERKNAETEVLKIYTEKNTILESIRDAFFAVDKNWLVTYWNKEAEKISGMPKNKVVGKNLWKVFPESISSEANKKYCEAVETNKVVVFEYYYSPLNSWYEITAYPGDNGLSVYFKDISERKISEIEFKRLNHDLQKYAKELAFSNNELEQFAYVASHDLQEPLRTVTSFLTLLEKKYGDSMDDKIKQYIHFAVDAARRMRQIILDLLEFSKIGKSEDTREEVDLNELVNEILLLFNKQIQENNAIIKIDKLPKLKTFRTPMRQVFQNLLSNSLKYRRDDVPPQITISSKAEKDYWEFMIADNGKGIGHEFLEKIFVIFQRLDNRDKHAGTGIGLAITKKIIENMNGKIWVESEEGKGSTFYFTIEKDNNTIE